ncbi:PTS system IIA component, Gat family [Lactobacillus bombicola]|jgi:galactitol PTS system EIIA component|uniref:PTS system IIA component, Gat family n=1 Tax=Lactobacillus bombicola TaxID=1505723 RepID=A0A1I1S4E1_9LACO|nr:PTS sugar transporter subunit IIA [Lactobacillus bombicola]SFD41405.1 PTS system IIA component, Gat family [Lactobacillus bombicola]
MGIKIFVNEGTPDISTYQAAIKFAGLPMLKANGIYSQFSQACIKREKQFPTGLKLADGMGIAIPHGDSNLVKVSGISFVRLLKPVSFGLMEDAQQQIDCKFLFNLALAKGDEHLTILRKLMKLFQSKEFIQDLAELPLDLLTSNLQTKLN